MNFSNSYTNLYTLNEKEIIISKKFMKYNIPCKIIFCLLG